MASDDEDDMEEELFGLPAGASLGNAVAEEAPAPDLPLLTVVERLVFAGAESTELLGCEDGVDTVKRGREGGGLPPSILQAARFVLEGKYLCVLTETPVGQTFFAAAANAAADPTSGTEERVRQALLAALTSTTNLLGATADSSSNSSSSNSSSTTPERAFECLCVGIALLNLYLQANYTGPHPDLTVQQAVKSFLSPFLSNSSSSNCRSNSSSSSSSSSSDTKADELMAVKNNPFEADEDIALSLLSADGESPYLQCVLPQALLLARLLLHSLAFPSLASYLTPLVLHDTTGKPTLPCNPSLPPFLPPVLATSKAWSARACVTHRRLLPGRRPTLGLWTEFSLLLGPQELGEGVREGGRVCDEWRTREWLERGLGEYHFREGDEGRRAFESAKKEAGMVCRMTAMLGKRTKFQEKALPQMVLVVESCMGEGGGEGGGKGRGGGPGKPLEVGHGQDSVLLEKTEFIGQLEDEGKEGEGGEGIEGAKKKLHPLEQAVLLALCLEEGRGSAASGDGGLTAEQVEMERGKKGGRMGRR